MSLSCDRLPSLDVGQLSAQLGHCEFPCSFRRCLQRHTGCPLAATPIALRCCTAPAPSWLVHGDGVVQVPDSLSFHAETYQAIHQFPLSRFFEYAAKNTLEPAVACPRPFRLRHPGRKQKPARRVPALVVPASHLFDDHNVTAVSRRGWWQGEGRVVTASD